MIRIKLDRETWTTGEFVTGRVFWSGETDHRQRRIIAAAVWETDGAGNPARGLGRAMAFATRDADATFSFRLLVPHEGPVSYKGQLTGIIWKLRVRVELVQDPLNVVANGVEAQVEPCGDMLVGHAQTDQM